MIVIGNGFEWFDFIVYSFFVVIIVKLFFLIGNELMFVLFIVVMFGVGFFMWLVGGIVFGVYVDKVGCKVVLLFMILLMVVGIVLIGIVLIYE